MTRKMPHGGGQGALRGHGRAVGVGRREGAPSGTGSALREWAGGPGGWGHTGPGRAAEPQQQPLPRGSQPRVSLAAPSAPTACARGQSGAGGRNQLGTGSPQRLSAQPVAARALRSDLPSEGQPEARGGRCPHDPCPERVPGKRLPSAGQLPMASRGLFPAARCAMHSLHQALCGIWAPAQLHFGH